MNYVTKNDTIQICKRCVIDNSDSNVNFDENGYCSLCTSALDRMPKEYFPNEEGEKKLDAIFETIKKKGIDREYDCMVGVSGGIDSSYIIYLGHQYGLRMLAIHIDDGFDTPVATENIRSLCEKAKTPLINVKPDMTQYVDLIRSFFFARVPNLAMPQDNILFATLNQITRKHHIHYNLSGANFATESILQHSRGIVNACDIKNIKAIHKQFGREKINKLPLLSFREKYIAQKYFFPVTKVLPLNYIDYRMDHVLEALHTFSNYNYYGGKHYESILTRFLQCYYLPEKYGIDKRKSHLSSLIISNQLTREDALRRLQEPLYDEKTKEYDFHYIAEYLGMTYEDFLKLLEEPVAYHTDYPHSYINNLASVARRFRRFWGE